MGLTERGEGPTTGRSFMPPLITLSLRSRKPDISMAPQKETSPSPCEKCMSPIERLPPGTKTGRYTTQPRERFLMSQLPPFSRPGTVRAASPPVLSHVESLPIFSVKWPILPSIAPTLLGRHARAVPTRAPNA